MNSITIHNSEDFASMRKAGEVAKTILDYITDFIKPGVTTNELNTICHNKIIELGAIPAPLNYRGFPKSICTSVDHVVCHGIPNDTPLRKGSIINIDVTVIVDGWHGDASRMYKVGKILQAAQRLIDVTYECLMIGIEKVKPGVKLNEIGKAIQSYAEKNHYSVVRDFCGHGIGRIFHAPPDVVHFYEPNQDIVIKEGMFFTIEPMINIGTYETKLLQDGWTAVTKDRSLSAQFEHTIGVTKDGAEVFTA